MTGHIDATPIPLPFTGSTPLSTHCSHQGAVRASEKAGRQALALLAAYRTHGPLSDQQAADLLHVQRNSVNARRAALIKLGLVDPQPKGTVPNPITGIRNTTWGLR